MTAIEREEAALMKAAMRSAANDAILAATRVGMRAPGDDTMDMSAPRFRLPGGGTGPAATAIVQWRAQIREATGGPIEP